jgi:hypothetical protein
LKKLQDAVISKAKDITMIKLLVDYGAEMTGDVFSSVVNEKKLYNMFKRRIRSSLWLICH